MMVRLSGECQMSNLHLTLDVSFSIWFRGMSVMLMFLIFILLNKVIRPSQSPRPAGLLSLSQPHSAHDLTSAMTSWQWPCLDLVCLSLLSIYMRHCAIAALQHSLTSMSNFSVFIVFRVFSSISCPQCFFLFSKTLQGFSC